MMLEVLKIIWSFRRLFAGVVLLLAIAWLLHTKTALQRDLAQEQLRNNQLVQEVSVQNAEINRWKSVADERAKIAKAAMEAAKKAAATHVTKAQRILVAKPTADDECVAALNLLREYQ